MKNRSGKLSAWEGSVRRFSHATTVGTRKLGGNGRLVAPAPGCVSTRFQGLNLHDALPQAALRKAALDTNGGGEAAGGEAGGMEMVPIGVLRCLPFLCPYAMLWTTTLILRALERLRAPKVRMNQAAQITRPPSEVVGSFVS